MSIVIEDADEQAKASEYLTATLGLIDPTAEADVSRAAAQRLSSLRGAHGVLLDNTKGNAGPLLKHVGKLLEEKYGTLPFDVVRKLVYSRPADPVLIEELSRSYAFVVTGVGACGSCTSGCVRDSVELEARGIPTAAIHTEVFTNSAIAHGAAFGRPDMKFGEVEHPIAAVSDDELKRRAHAVVDRVAGILTGVVA